MATQKHVKAAKDTLQNIAALTMVHARNLKAGDLLSADLGYKSKEFGNLSVRQRLVGDRLRSDSGKTKIMPDDLVQLSVMGVLVLTFKRAIKLTLTDDEINTLIKEAKKEL
jgi:hypothetical protein